MIMTFSISLRLGIQMTLQAGLTKWQKQRRNCKSHKFRLRRAKQDAWVHLSAMRQLLRPALEQVFGNLCSGRLVRGLAQMQQGFHLAQPSLQVQWRARFHRNAGVLGNWRSLTRLLRKVRYRYFGKADIAEQVRPHREGEYALGVTFRRQLDCLSQAESPGLVLIASGATTKDLTSCSPSPKSRRATHPAGRGGHASGQPEIVNVGADIVSSGAGQSAWRRRAPAVDDGSASASTAGTIIRSDDDGMRTLRGSWGHK